MPYLRLGAPRRFLPPSRFGRRRLRLVFPHYTEIARWRCLRTCWFEPTRLGAHAFGFRCLASTPVRACPIDANSFRLSASFLCGSAYLTLLAGDFVPGFQDSAACWFAVGVGSNQ